MKRSVALPGDHGSWAFFLGPLAIGLFAGGRWHTTALYLTVAAACGFLARQPVTLLVKIHAGRRPRDTRQAAVFWIALYSALGGLHVVGLVLRGFGYVLYLAAPGILVFAWYLFLVSRRAERRQWLVEIVATGAMALVAPAGMWVGLGHPDPLGWLLWLLVWAQAATAIVYAYLRLEQRTLTDAPDATRRLRMGVIALAAGSASLALAAGLSATGLLPRWLFVPFLVQWAEVVWGVSRPAVGAKPKAIGYRQLAVSVTFTVLFVLAWGS